jgi:hypothetical protein
MLQNNYLAESERPWASLLFLLPLIIVYELYALGLIGQRPAGPVRTDVHITAFLLIDEFIRLLGGTGRHFPAFALAAMLLGAHLLRKDPWNLKIGTLAGMAAESLFWALPLLVFGWIAARYLPLGSGLSNRHWIILCFGAGIYEEMVFRLIGVTLLSLVLRDILRIPPRPSLVLVLLTSAVLFSLYHYLSPGEDFQLKSFAFRTVAGVYFGALYCLRGFGLTAGSHTAYDLVAVGLLSG